MDATLSAPVLPRAAVPPGADRPSEGARTRTLAAVAFVDIADSTNQLVQHGDRQWSALLLDFHYACARIISQHGGRLVKTLGDGLLATFPTASEAIYGLREIRIAARGRGLQLRGAVHAAEIEVMGTDIAGVGVHVAARVEAITPPGEVWVTSTVQQVIAGSHVVVDDRGDHHLRGFDEPWRLYAVRS